MPYGTRLSYFRFELFNKLKINKFVSHVMFYFSFS